MSKCNVCNKSEAFGVFSSSCGPISFAYCKDCGSKGAEPYGAVVAYLSGAVNKGEDLKPEKKLIQPGYYKVIDISLEIAGKTHEEFYADVDKAIEEENKYWDKLYEKERLEE